MTGSGTLNCQADSTFDQPPPTCEPNYCSDPTGLYPNVVVTSSGPYIYQDTLSVQV